MEKTFRIIAEYKHTAPYIGLAERTYSDALDYVAEKLHSDLSSCTRVWLYEVSNSTNGFSGIETLVAENGVGVGPLAIKE